jgi:DNA-binding MarR family transcriptional regulator
MKPSDAKVRQLRETIRDVVRQFRCSDATLVNKPLGEINIAEVHVIEFLGDRGSCMMRELAEFLLVAVNTVTSIVDKLEQKKLVRRERDESDRRIVMVQLTAKGQEAFQAILEERLNGCRAMLTPLTEDEQDIFILLMRKIGREGGPVGR